MPLLESLLSGESPDGYVFEEYGECLLASDREDEARPYSRQAFELLSTNPWYLPMQTERPARLRQLGRGAREEPPERARFHRPSGDRGS